jgi:hypothetical protein
MMKESLAAVSNDHKRLQFADIALFHLFHFPCSVGCPPSLIHQSSASMKNIARGLIGGYILAGIYTAIHLNQFDLIFASFMLCLPFFLKPIH